MQGLTIWIYYLEWSSWGRFAQWDLFEIYLVILKNVRRIALTLVRFNQHHLRGKNLVCSKWFNFGAKLGERQLTRITLIISVFCYKSLRQWGCRREVCGSEKRQSSDWLRLQSTILVFVGLNLSIWGLRQQTHLYIEDRLLTLFMRTLRKFGLFL